MTKLVVTLHKAGDNILATGTISDEVVFSDVPFVNLNEFSGYAKRVLSRKYALKIRVAYL